MIGSWSIRVSSALKLLTLSKMGGTLDPTYSPMCRFAWWADISVCVYVFGLGTMLSLFGALIGQELSPTSRLILSNTFGSRYIDTLQIMFNASSRETTADNSN